MLKISAVAEDCYDEPEVDFLRLELAEMEKISELRLKLAKVEMLVKRKRLISCKEMKQEVVKKVKKSGEMKIAKDSTNNNLDNSEVIKYDIKYYYIMLIKIMLFILLRILLLLFRK